MSSGQPPNQPPYPPFQSPAIHYDEAGNPYFEDANGRRFAYYGQFPISGAAVPVVPVIPHDNMRDGPNEPLPQMYQASTAAGPSSGGHFAIDPALQLPLPDTNDNDLSDGPTIAKARGYSAAEKIAGTRRKGKGKARAAPETSRKRKRPVSDDEEDDENARHGRPRGAGNYTPEDVSALLDFVEKELPLGQRGWQSIHRSFTRWSLNNGRPARAMKSLETKFKQLVKVKKPTGDAYCPPEVKRAHCIDGLINERACTWDISDSELDGDEGDVAVAGEDDEDEDHDAEARVVEHRKASQTQNTIREAIVRRPEAPIQHRAPRNNGAELMSKLSNAFDPSIQQARDAERANRSLQNAQFLTLSQQLRDATSLAESLRGQIYTLQTRIHEAERARDRAELKLEMTQLSHAPPNLRHRNHPRRRRRSPSTKRSLIRVNGKTRVDERFPEGGSHTYWVTDPSSDEGSGSNKESHPPFHRYPSPGPSRHRCRLVSPSHGRSQEHFPPHHNGDNDFDIIIPPAPRFHSAASNLNDMLTCPEPPFQASAPSDMEGFELMENTSTEEDKEGKGHDDDE